jgi:hypothetical protein
MDFLFMKRKLLMVLTHLFQDKLPIGITQLEIPANLHVGQTAKVNGTVNMERRTTLILKGPGQAEDSVTLKGAGLKSFSSFLSITTSRIVSVRTCYSR